jgi:hypothetical protein
MTIRMHRTALLALAAFLAACGAGTEPSAEQTTTPAPSSTIESETTMPANPEDSLPVVAAAIDDLARRLGAPPEDIEVLSAEEVTWPDGSLGCPEPGMSYTQALVNGAKVVLRYEDRVYVYHAGADAKPFLCPSDDKDGGHDMVPPPGYND